MAELADAGNKEKPFFGIAVFQNTVKTFQTLLNISNIGIGNIIKYGLIIFINQNNNLSIG